jgi:hypothetical protein
VRSVCKYILPCLQVSATVVTVAAGLATLDTRNSPEVVRNKIDPPVETKDFGKLESTQKQDRSLDRSLKCEGSVSRLVEFWEEFSRKESLVNPLSISSY